MYPEGPNRDPYQQNPYGGSPYGNDPYGGNPYMNAPRPNAPYPNPPPYPNGPGYHTIPPQGYPGPARGQKPRARIQPRFFLSLLVLALIGGLVYFALQGMGGNRRGTAVAQKHSIGSQFQGQGVIVRDEALTAADSITNIDFVAEEGALVFAKEVLCNVYSAGYNQAEINRLETYREKIRQYHRDQFKSSQGDVHLEALENTINSLSVEVRTLVQGQGSGSLTNMERQLRDALQARQNYLRQKYPDDQALTTLYKEESQQLRKIESWTTPFAAQDESLVSFYTDGYETTVNALTFETITPAQVHTVLAGQQLETDIVARGRQPIYRTVAPTVWYILLLSNDRNWNPVEGQAYKVQLEGFDSFLVDATVKSFTRVSGELLVRLEVRSDVRPVLNIRTCRMAVGEFVDGLSVPIDAIIEDGGVMGVVVHDANGDMFVPVTVISNDGKDAFIRPVYPGSLLDGQKVVTY